MASSFFGSIELVISIEFTSNEENIRSKSLESVSTERQGMGGVGGEKEKKENL